MRKWKPKMRATEKSTETSVFQQHTPWERKVQAAHLSGSRAHRCQGVPLDKPPLH